MAPRYDARDTYRCADERARSYRGGGTDPGRRARRLQPHDNGHGRNDHRARRLEDVAHADVHVTSVHATLLPHHVAAYPEPECARRFAHDDVRAVQRPRRGHPAGGHRRDREPGGVGLRRAGRGHREDVGGRNVPAAAHHHRQRHPAGRRHTGVALAFLSMGEYPKKLESLTVDVDGYVARVTLVGPGKGNAMGPAFWAELPEVFSSLDADPDVRAIVLTGSGRNFSYGLDVAAMGDTLSPMLADGALARPRAEFHA